MKIKTEVVVVVVGERERERERDEFLFSQNFRGLIMISLVFLPPTHSHSRSFTYLFRNDRRRRTKSSSWYLCVEKKKKIERTPFQEKY